MPSKNLMHLSFVAVFHTCSSSSIIVSLSLASFLCYFFLLSYIKVCLAVCVYVFFLLVFRWLVFFSRRLMYCAVQLFLDASPDATWSRVQTEKYKGEFIAAWIRVCCHAKYILWTEMNWETRQQPKEADKTKINLYYTQA